MINSEVWSQQVVNLYDGNAPGLKAEINIQEINTNEGKEDIVCLRNITVPTLTIYKPKKKTSDAAVIICPGGGYYIVAHEYEGLELGKWFAKRGVTAFVLKYRLPQGELFDQPTIRPLQDVQQAFRFVRSNANKFGINTSKIGVMGFSAGGHLASTASNNFNEQVGEIKDNLNIRPDFSILIYPVISFNNEFGHQGSKENLIGKDATEELIKKYSNELNVTDKTPPTFLLHAFDDWVHVNNSIEYYKALKRNNVPSEMHLYDTGGHGFSLSKKTKGPIKDWHIRLEEWLKSNGWMR
jgi:acetyl esterase/lipase